MRKKLPLACVLLVSTFLSISQLMAQQLEPSVREELPLRVLSQFWSVARTPDGERLFPKDDQERNALPISRSLAQQVVDVGQISGAAERCGLDWRDNYTTLRQSARASGYTTTQVAFIGILHGATQQTLINKLKGTTCSAADKEQAEQMLRVSPNKLKPTLIE